MCVCTSLKLSRPPDPVGNRVAIVKNAPQPEKRKSRSCPGAEVFVRSCRCTSARFIIVARPGSCVPCFNRVTERIGLGSLGMDRGVSQADLARQRADAAVKLAVQSSTFLTLFKARNCAARL